jgi:putative transposase
VTAAQRRTAVAYVQTHAGVSQRRACRWLAVSRTPVRYVAHPRQEDGPLRDRLRALAAAHPRWGAPLLTWKLRREGWRDNHKRIERVYRQDGLAVRKRRRKKLTRPRAPHVPAGAPNDRWSMDFLRDTLASGRVIRVFTTVDDCTREALALAVDTSFPGVRVVAVLDGIAAARGYPRQLICDNDLHPLSRVDSRRRDLRSRDGGAAAPSDDPHPHQHHVRTRVPSGLPRRTSPLLTIVGQHSIPTPV